MNGTNPVPAPGLPDRWSGLSGVLSLLNKGPEAVQEILDPLNNTILERFNGTAFLQTLPVESYDSWLDYYDVNFDNGTAGGGALLVSRLLDEEALTGDHEALKGALQATTEASEIIHFYLLGGKGIHEAKPRGGSNAVNPGWRKAYVHTRKSTPPSSSACIRCSSMLEPKTPADTVGGKLPRAGSSRSTRPQRRR